MRKFWFLVLLALLLTGCGEESPPQPISAAAPTADAKSVPMPMINEDYPIVRIQLSQGGRTGALEVQHGFTDAMQARYKDADYRLVTNSAGETGLEVSFNGVPEKTWILQDVREVSLNEPTRPDPYHDFRILTWSQLLNGKEVTIEVGFPSWMGAAWTKDNGLFVKMVPVATSPK